MASATPAGWRTLRQQEEGEAAEKGGEVGEAEDSWHVKNELVPAVWHKSHILSSRRHDTSPAKTTLCIARVPIRLNASQQITKFNVGSPGIWNETWMTIRLILVVIFVCSLLVAVRMRQQDCII
jgi:hypothetical protein